MKLREVNLTKQEVKDMVDKYMLETYPRFGFLAETADGMYLYDENGEGYLDFYGGVAVNNVGSCNKKVVEAVQDQVADIMHTFNYPYTIPQALLSKQICETIGMDKIFYQNSGAEANECMIKMARKYGIEKYGPEHYHIITAKKSFHGRTFGSMSATGQPGSAIHTGFGPLLDGFTYAEFNNVEAFAAEITPNTIAIMLEPVQGEGGVIPATQEFLEGIRKLCDDHNLLLLFDEVQTGWGRTGAIMAYMGYNVKPDAVSMAKGMGGGMPIAACCATDEMAKAFSMGAHGTTYGGNPVTCAASYAATSEIIERDLSGNAKEMGAYFVEELKKMPHIVEVRGKGLLVGCEYDMPIAAAVKAECMANHLLITAIGTSINRMIPPLILTKEHIDIAVATLKAAIEKVSAQ